MASLVDVSWRISDDAEWAVIEEIIKDEMKEGNAPINDNQLVVLRNVLLLLADATSAADHLKHMRQQRTTAAVTAVTARKTDLETEQGKLDADPGKPTRPVVSRV